MNGALSVMGIIYKYIIIYRDYDIGKCMVERTKNNMTKTVN